jgi:hypothetical protein
MFSLIITFIGQKNEPMTKEARVCVDDHGVVFVFNGRFWTSAMDMRDVAAPVVTVVAKGRRYICHNVTLEEALAGCEKYGTLGL